MSPPRPQGSLCKPHPRSWILAMAQLQARAGQGGAGTTSPVGTLCQHRPGAECLPTLMTDREQTPQAAAFSCPPFAPRRIRARLSGHPGAHLDGAGDVETLLHARDLQLQHLQVFAAEGDGARGASEPGGGRRRVRAGCRSVQADRQTRDGAELPSPPRNVEQDKVGGLCRCRIAGSHMAPVARLSEAGISTVSLPCPGPGGRHGG